MSPAGMHYPESIPEPPLTCQDCTHGLIRVERTKDYNYEGCSLSLIPLVPRANIPACQHFEKADPELIAARAPYRQRRTIVFGPPLEFPE